MFKPQMRVEHAFFAHQELYGFKFLPNLTSKCQPFETTLNFNPMAKNFHLFLSGMKIHRKMIYNHHILRCK